MENQYIYIKEPDIKILEEVLTYIKLKNKHIEGVNINIVQLSNVIRLINNDAIFNFDEVGCGKTLAAIMCSLYIVIKKYKEGKENNINILFLAPTKTVRETIYNEFKSKTYLNLLKEELNLNISTDGNMDCNKNNILILLTNANSDEFRSLSKKSFDFVVIDEAHKLVCNSQKQINEKSTIEKPARLSTQKYKICSEIKAEKIMFLTASPYVYHIGQDQLCYEYLINSMLRKKPLTDYFKKDKSDNNDNIINMMYDSNPVNPTEFKKEYYTGNMSLSFKEMAYSLDLENLSNTTTSTSKSRISEIWNYLDDKPLNNSYTDTKDYFYKHFTNDLRNLFEDETQNNKVVIFVRFEYEGRNIIKHLCDLKEKEIESSQQIPKFRTSENKEKSIRFVMAKFGDDTLNTLTQNYNTTNKDYVPDVLILSSAIGNTGINLPAYNYVINFHIGKNSAEFEQRFGRIDRYNSINNELHNIFVISKYNGVYFFNFIYAMYNYITKILRFMPTKNIFINENTIKLIRTWGKNFNSYNYDTLKYEIFVIICKDISNKNKKISEVKKLLDKLGKDFENDFSAFLNNREESYLNYDENDFYNENTLEDLVQRYLNLNKETQEIYQVCNNISNEYDKNPELFKSSQNVLFNGNVIALNGIIDKIINNLNLNINKEKLSEIQNNSIERCVANMSTNSYCYGENHGNLYNYLNSIENGTFKNHLNDLKAILSQGIIATYHISHYKNVELPKDFLNYISPKQEPTWNIITNNIISKFNISEKDIITFISICYKKQLFKIQYNNKIYDCFSAIAYNDFNFDDIIVSKRIINLAQLTKDKKVWQDKNIAYVFCSDSLIEEYGPINTNMLHYNDDAIIRSFEEFYRKEYFEKEYVDQAFKEYSNNLNSENVAIRIDTKDVIPQYLQENREVCDMIRSIICYIFRPFYFRRADVYCGDLSKNPIYYGKTLTNPQKEVFNETVFTGKSNPYKDMIYIDDKYILLDLSKQK